MKFALTLESKQDLERLITRFEKQTGIHQQNVFGMTPMDYSILKFFNKIDNTGGLKFEDTKFKG